MDVRVRMVARGDPTQAPLTRGWNNPPYMDEDFNDYEEDDWEELIQVYQEPETEANTMFTTLLQRLGIR